MNEFFDRVPAVAALRFVTALILVASVLPTVGHEVDDPSQYETTEVAVEGFVRNPSSYTVDELKVLPSRTIDGMPMRCSPTREKGHRDYRGVLLRTVLDRAEVDIEERHSRNRTYVVVTASDDYSVVFSWHELFNTEVGNDVLVIYEKSGKPLEADEGRIALVSAADEFTCGRHVKWVNRIRVLRFGQEP